MSSAKAARTSSSVTSLPKRSLPSFAISRAATLTPRSAWISASSRSFSVAWSSFFLVKIPGMLSVKSSVMLSVTFLADFESPSRRRPSQPFFSIAPSVSTSAPVRESGTALGDSLEGGEIGVSA